MLLVVKKKNVFHTVPIYESCCFPHAVEKHDIAGKDLTTPPQDHTEHGCSRSFFLSIFFSLPVLARVLFFCVGIFFFDFFLARNFFSRFQQESFLLEQNH